MPRQEPKRGHAPVVSITAVVVFVALASVALIAFSVTRSVVADQQERLLEDRAGEAASLLTNLLESQAASLSILATLAALPDGDVAERIAQGVAGDGFGSVIVAATEEDRGFRIAVGVEGFFPEGGLLTDDVAALASRALAQGDLVAELLPVQSRRLLMMASPAFPPTRAVALLGFPVDLLSPLPQTPGTPFSEIRGTLYASVAPDPDTVVLTTEEEPTISGPTVQRDFDLGAEQWTLVVGSSASLTGAFSEQASWLLLGVGLVAAGLAAAVVQTIARRRSVTEALVEQRTRELEAARSLLERLVVSGPTVVLRGEVSPTTARLSYVSPNIERIFGIPRSELLERGSLADYLHPDDLGSRRAWVQHLLEGESGIEEEIRVRHGDGSYRWVSATSVPDPGVERPDADTVAHLSYLTDITERRLADQARREAQEAAEAANRSKSEFLSRMSHELRTPLNSVLGFGQLLEMSPLGDEERDSVDHILKAGRHLLTLINEVLDIARIEAGRLLLSPEAVLVHDLVQESLDLVRPLAEARQIRMVVDADSMAGVYAFTDSQRAKQILLNLMTNAVKYNRLRGTVALSCTQPTTTRVRIEVADTGPGIRREQMERLFSPFDRLDAADTEVEGTGIGLMLSKNLAEAMGGTLSVESVFGQGSTFTLDLPRVEGPVERYERENGTAVIPAYDGHPPRQRRTVLYIEDNLANLTLVERVLARRPDLEMVSAMQGRLGVELARQHHPALILLDLHLPDVGGDAILMRLREDPSTAAIPVVIVTADATTGQVQRLMSAGATAYLTKPLDVTELVRLIDRVLAPA